MEIDRFSDSGSTTIAIFSASSHDDPQNATMRVDALRASTRDIRIFERLPASLWPVL